MTKLKTAVADGIITITLDDPPANTYSYEMMRELDDAILQARMDASIHVIVITGAGEKFFCAGANIGMLKDADPTFKYYFCLHANETLTRLEQTPSSTLFLMTASIAERPLSTAASETSYITVS